MAKVKHIQWSLKVDEGPFVDPLPPFSDDEINKLLENMNVCPIMARREPFADRFVRKTKPLQSDGDHTDLEVINMYLASLYNNEFRTVDLEDLRNIAKCVNLSYTNDQIQYIEEKLIRYIGSDFEQEELELQSLNKFAGPPFRVQQCRW